MKFDWLIQTEVVAIVNNQILSLDKCGCGWTNVARRDVAWTNVAWTNVAWTNVARTDVAWTNIAWPMVLGHLSIVKDGLTNLK